MPYVLPAPITSPWSARRGRRLSIQSGTNIEHAARAIMGGAQVRGGLDALQEAIGIGMEGLERDRQEPVMPPRTAHRTARAMALVVSDTAVRADA
jgi:hypothetical protein